VTPAQKILCALLLFSAWGALVFTDRAPVADFITALRDALIALGVFQALIINPKE